MLSDCQNLNRLTGIVVACIRLTAWLASSLKLAARAVLSADAGLLVHYDIPKVM